MRVQRAEEAVLGFCYWGGVDTEDEAVVAEERAASLGTEGRGCGSYDCDCMDSLLNIKEYTLL